MGFGLLLLFWIIPAQTDQDTGAAVPPALLPQICAVGITGLAAILTLNASDEFQRCFRGLLPSLPGLVNREEWRSGTPSNLWPEDRWFVYTGWDLWGTKVSGTSELIEAVAAHAELA